MSNWWSSSGPQVHDLTPPLSGFPPLLASFSGRSELGSRRPLPHLRMELLCVSNHMYFVMQTRDRHGNVSMAQPPLVTTEHPVTLVALLLPKNLSLKECLLSWQHGDRRLWSTRLSALQWFLSSNSQLRFLSAHRKNYFCFLLQWPLVSKPWPSPFTFPFPCSLLNCLVISKKVSVSLICCGDGIMIWFPWESHPNA